MDGWSDGLTGFSRRSRNMRKPTSTVQLRLLLFLWLASIPKRMAFLISEQSLDLSPSSAAASASRPKIASTVEADIACAL
jgi:hypothetical protein